MDHILGQSAAIDTLQSALQAGRVHHAFVFHGPAGVGKFTTAIAFARVLLCHEPQADLTGRITACGACASCRLLPEHVEQADDQAAADDDAPAELGAAHPDFHIVTKELARYSDDRAIRDRKLTNIPVAVLEAHLIAPVYLAAKMRHHKVFVVDEAELIDGTGQNKLLKTLEEPPAGTYLILVTANEDRLLPTIRSRCQRVGFFPLPDEAIRGWYERQSPGWRDEETEWMVDFAAGSLGRAALAVRYDLVRWARAVIPALADLSRGRPSAELGEQMGTLMDEFAVAWVAAHENASKEAANKRAAEMMWTLISQHARRRIAQLAADCRGEDVVAAEAALLPWLGVIDAVTQVEREVNTNVNLKLACDHLVSLMSRNLAPAAAR